MLILEVVLLIWWYNTKIIFRLIMILDHKNWLWKLKMGNVWLPSTKRWANKKGTAKRLLVKRSQSLSNQAHYLAILFMYKVVILTKFHKDRATIVDFSIMANFLSCAIFCFSVFKMSYKESKDVDVNLVVKVYWISTDTRWNFITVIMLFYNIPLGSISNTLMIMQLSFKWFCEHMGFC